VLLQYKPWTQIYSCNACTAEDKKDNGCRRNRRLAIVKAKCVCEGQFQKCEICKGKGSFPIKRCPRKLITKNIAGLLPFFHWYRNTDQFPDNGSMLAQPDKLLKAFDLMSTIATRREIAIAEK
jgi:hypothetical protein